MLCFQIIISSSFMALRLSLLSLLLALALAAAGAGAAAAKTTFADNELWGGAVLTSWDAGLESLSVCDGTVGKCVGGDEEEEEMAMESESSRRSLAATARFISYGALNKNRVPCNRRGQSYYNCQRQGQANPYRRGCSIITKCARILD